MQRELFRGGGICEFHIVNTVVFVRSDFCCLAALVPLVKPRPGYHKRCYIPLISLAWSGGKTWDKNQIVIRSTNVRLVTTNNLYKFPSSSMARRLAAELPRWSIAGHRPEQ